MSLIQFSTTIVCSILKPLTKYSIVTAMHDVIYNRLIYNSDLNPIVFSLISFLFRGIKEELLS